VIVLITPSRLKRIFWYSATLPFLGIVERLFVPELSNVVKPGQSPRWEYSSKHRTNNRSELGGARQRLARLHTRRVLSGWAAVLARVPSAAEAYSSTAGLPTTPTIVRSER
jgi:hypothetical protein